MPFEVCHSAGKSSLASWLLDRGTDDLESERKKKSTHESNAGESKIGKNINFVLKSWPFKETFCQVPDWLNLQLYNISVKI